MAGLVTAADELDSVARHLREIGEGELVRELTAAIRRGVDPVRDDIRAGLKPKLPDRYAEVLDADLAINVSVRTGDRNPGVTVKATTRSGQRRRIRRLDQGILAHPLWGNRKHWYNQGEPSVQPGWFTGPADDAAPRVRAEIERALDEVSVKATSRGA